MHGAGLADAASYRKNKDMQHATKAFIAVLAVFIGALLSDIAFGDGIEAEDINQALMVAGIAGTVQYWLSRKKQE